MYKNICFFSKYFAIFIDSYIILALHYDYIAINIVKIVFKNYNNVKFEATCSELNQSKCKIGFTVMKWQQT